MKITPWERAKLAWLGLLWQLGFRSKYDIETAMYSIIMKRVASGELDSSAVDSVTKYFVEADDGSVYYFPVGTTYGEVEAFKDKLNGMRNGKAGQAE